MNTHKFFLNIKDSYYHTYSYRNVNDTYYHTYSYRNVKDIVTTIDQKKDYPLGAP